ncbi:MAG: hypothetical protein Q8891_03780 [Bacteroidota bacterium]|nr:hypothetical protein [Bacteroidota bacterium]
MKIEKAQKTCLLIAPMSFYSYSEYLKNTLILRGYNVTVSNDEYPANNIGKIMGKLRIPLLMYLTGKKIKQQYLQGKKYNLVLIIKGRGISTELIKQLKKVSPKVVAYTYDSFRYHDAPIKWLKYADKFYTFDYLDSERHNISVIELFSSFPESLNSKKCTYEISVITRNHSDRLKYIDCVLSNLNVEKKFVYIFEQNIFTFIQNFIKNPMLYFKFRKHISFKSLPYDEYTKALHESNFTIDFAHPSQSGITIRCFEALSSGTKIITNNPFVSRYKYFNETNTIIYNNTTDPESLRSRFTQIANNIPGKHNRTISDFIEDLIS